MMEPVGFMLLDYVVFLGLLGSSLLVGLVVACSGGKQQSAQEVLNADRKLHPLPVSISIFVTYISGILFLGYTAEMYLHGTMMFLTAIAYCIGYFVSIHLFVGLMYPLKLTSVFQYYMLRFKSPILTRFCALAFILNWVFYIGVALYAPSTALQAVTGIPTLACIALLGAIATVYTVLGGVKAVVWTDTIQAGFILLGSILLLILASNKVGGLSQVWDIAKSEGRIRFFEMDPTPFQRMSAPIALSTAITALADTGVLQSTVQRYSSVPSPQGAKLALYLQIPYVLGLFSIAMLLGLSVFAYFDSIGCDPLKAGIISNPNQLLSYFTLHILPYPGLGGIFIGILFSGSLSSVSSGLNSLAAITWTDFVSVFCKVRSETKKATIIKIITALYGCAGIALGASVPIFQGHVGEICLAIIGGTTSAIAGVVFLGAMFPWAQWKGALCGVITGISMVAWINIGIFGIYTVTLGKSNRKQPRQTLSPPYTSSLHTSTLNCTTLVDITSMTVNITTMPVDSASNTSPESKEAESDIFLLYRISFLLISVCSFVSTVIVGALVSFLTGCSKPSEVDRRLLSPIMRKFWSNTSIAKGSQELENLNPETVGQ